MEQYFSKQPKVVNGVPQRLYFMFEQRNGDSARVSVMSLFEHELSEFSKKYEFVRQGTEAMAVFKLKE